MKKHALLVTVLTGSLIAFLLFFAGCGSMPSQSGSSLTSGNSGGTASTTPVSTSGGTGAAGPAEYLYAIENPNAASVVEGFSISNTGALTPMSPTVSAGDNANDIVADQAGSTCLSATLPDVAPRRAARFS